VLFICLGIEERVSRRDISESDLFLDLFVLDDGVDFGIIEIASVEAVREFVEDCERTDMSWSSFGGTLGAAGWPGSGFRLSLILRGRSGVMLLSSGIGWDRMLVDPEWPESEALLLFRTCCRNSKFSCRLTGILSWTGGGGSSILDGDAIAGRSLLEVFLFGLGALKSWNLVPRIRGSYDGSSTLVFICRGRSSGVFCPAFRRANSVDIGFFKKGSPFFPFGCSPAGAGFVAGDGSVVNLVPAGRHPDTAGAEKSLCCWI
jgi:hypothetical protein